DDEANKSGDVLEDEPLSVSTKRSMEEISAERDRVWGSKPKSNGKPRTVRPRTATQVRAKTAKPKARQTSNRPGKNGLTPNQLRGAKLTHPDKVLYREQGITKLELAQYYVQVADWILPHLADRPLVLVRCPEGRGKSCFYQKHPGAGAPKALRQIPIRGK